MPTDNMEINTGIGRTEITPKDTGVTLLQQENLVLKGQITRLQQENQDLKEQLEKADELAVEDFLTGLYNRRGLERSVEEVSEGIKREMENKDEYITIFFIDLNDLKQVNTKSYDEGDRYILTMANMLRKVFTRKTDIVARWGGDEFAVVSPSNEPFVDTAVDRLNKFGRDPEFQHLRYCAGAVSFKVGDVAKEMGITEDMDAKTISMMVEEYMSEKIKKAKELLQEAKERAKVLMEDGDKRSIIFIEHEIPKTT